MRSILILAIVAVVALAGVAMAQNQADLITGEFVFADYNDPLKALEARREMNAYVEQNRVYINLLNTTRDQDNWLRADFSTKVFPRIRFSRFDYNPGEGNATQDPLVCDPKSNATFPCNLTNGVTEFPGFTFRLGFIHLIEYEPQLPGNSNVTGSGACPVNPNVVSKISLINKKWNPMREQRSLMRLNNVTVNVSEYCTAWTQNLTSVAICMKIANIPHVDNKTGHAYGPNRVKFNLNVTNYNFVRENTKLGIVGFGSSKGEASKSEEKPRLILLDEEGAIEWDGIMKTDKGQANVESSDVVPLSELLPGELSEEEQSTLENEEESLPFEEEASGMIFCVEESTHAMHYEWHASAEINDKPGNESSINV